MSNFSEQIQALVSSLHANIDFELLLIAALWAIHFINMSTQYRLNNLGIVPRTITGFIGIFTSPFLHGNFSHLFFNSIPLFILASFMLLDGQVSFIVVSLCIIFIGGLAVWLFGRKACHIGASGLIMGYWGYLLVDAIQTPSLTTVFLIIICFYYFGGFITSLLPTEEKSSWEGHVFGLIAGLAVNYFHIAPYIMQHF